MIAANSSVLVTGATGFLGSHIIRKCLQTKQKVVGLCREQSDQWRLLDVQRGLTVDYLEFAGKEDQVGALVERHKPDVVIHSAAYGVQYDDQDPELAFKVNVLGSFNLLHECAKRGIQRFVYIGSCFEYGSKDHPILECESLAPTGLYGASKGASSLLLRRCAEALGVKIVVLRPFSLWGPFEGSHRLVPQVIRACLDRRPLSLTGCDQVRDYSYVEDMADWICRIALLDRFPEGQVVNLGTGEVKLKDFVLSIARELGGESLMKFGTLPYRTSEMKRLVADTTKQHRLLPNIRCSSVRKGVRAMVETIDR